MGGFRTRSGAQAVEIIAIKDGTINNTTTGTMNTSSLFTPMGSHTANSSLSSAVTLTPPANTNAITIGVEDQSVRIRMDGTDATTSLGFLFVDGNIVTFQFSEGVRFSVIEVNATATIQYQWGNI